MSEAAAKPEKAKLPLIPIIGAALVSAALAGGGAFFFASKKAPPPAKHAAAEGEHADGEEAPAEGEAAAEEEAAPAEHGEEKKSGGHGESKGEGKGGGKPGATYLPLAPAFVVNIGPASDSHFLQIEMEVLVKSDSVAETVKLHGPQIRNSILMLLSQQTMESIATREGKEALQKQVLEAIQQILTKQTGKPLVQAVFFTSFVTQ